MAARETRNAFPRAPTRDSMIDLIYLLVTVAFFALMGVLNLYVAYSFSTSTWASFKAFGATGLMLVFMIAQGFYLSRHLKPVAEPADKAIPPLGTASRPAAEK